jgi:hypothetical protein
LLALASSELGRFVGDLNATRAGRSLPLPSLFDFPGEPARGQALSRRSLTSCSAMRSGDVTGPI